MSDTNQDCSLGEQFLPTYLSNPSHTLDIEGTDMNQPLNKSQDNYSDHIDKFQSPIQNESFKLGLQCLQNDQALDLEDLQLRKGSLQDGEVNCQELEDYENDTRKNINQKLIKNKNYFMNSSENKKYVQKHSQAKYKLPQQFALITVGYSGDENQALYDKRSRSETPDKMSATAVLYRAHQKLQSRRKLSPSKLMENLLEKQKKAQQFREQIENSRKGLFNKIKTRQRVIKERWRDMMAEKKAKLYDKLEQAEERRESEIQSLKNKAKNEILKIDETNFIMKLTMNNLKMDLDSKMSETLERKKLLMKEYEQKYKVARQRKIKAVEKRREELQKESESKFQSNQHKREQADQRRKKMLKEKKRVAEEMARRVDIIKRKNQLGDRISDIMSFISNSENIWDFLSNDLNWSELYFNENGIFDLITKDHFGMDKLKLKQDAEILNQLIIVTEDGKIFARKELIATALKKMSRHHDYDDSSSGGEDYGGYLDEEEKELKVEYQHSSPIILKGHNLGNKQGGEFTLKQEGGCGSVEGGYYSDYSDKCSNSEDNSKKGGSLKSSVLSNNLESMQPNGALTDEDLNYQLYSIRVKMSMKRNVLKKNLSEDLTWADFLKNDFYYTNPAGANPFTLQYNRSLHSTPERKHEIPSESDKEAAAEHIGTHIQTSQSNHSLSSSVNQGKVMGKNTTNQPNQQQNTNGPHQEKQTISQQVYPSKKKKKPNSKASNQNYQNSQQNDLKSTGSQNSFKKFGGGSNQGSTQSLTMHQINQQNSSGSIYDAFKESQMNLPANRKSIQLDSKSLNTIALNNDSGRKKVQSRMHSSSVQEPSINSLITHCQTNATEDQQIGNEQQVQAFNAHTGTLMTQLITNNKPNPPSTKMIPKKLSANAVKILFPIREQKLLFKRPGKEGQFGKCRIVIKIEDLLNSRNSITLTPGSINATNLLQPLQTLTSNQITINEKGMTSNVLALLENSNGIDIGGRESKQEGNGEQIQNKSSRKSLQSTPSISNRRQSTDTNNSQQNIAQTSTNQTSNSQLQNTSLANQTLTAPTSSLTQLDSNQNPQQIPAQFSLSTPTCSSRLAASHLKLSGIGNFESKIPKITGSKMVNLGSNLPSENSPSPKKDLAQDTSFKQAVEDNNLNQSINGEIQPAALLPSSQQIQPSSSSSQVIHLNEQGYKESLIKIIMTDNVQLIKTEDNQKTLVLEGAEGDKIIDYLETHEFQVRYCRLCDLVIADHLTNEAHLNLKSHKRTRDDLLIKDTEDSQYSIFSFSSAPGEIEKELIREKEKALKRKVKRIKAQMMTAAESHESASYCPGKDITSANKKRFRIMCLDLEKQVIPIINNYEALENTLKEIIKIMDLKIQSDLHMMRKLKFIPILIEICKRISVCHKNEFKHLGRVLEFVIKIVNMFCSLRENRNYMLQTNRLSALIELLNWCLNRPTQLFYGITFLPQLFNILTQHIKHRAPYECQQMKELFIEYLICSQITSKIKGKLQFINGPLDLSETIGQVPLFLFKSASFIEALTSLIAIDSKIRPIYEKSSKIGEQVFFVVQNNELFGIIPMITTILLSRNVPFKTSATQPVGITKVLPQTILSLAIISIKIINNIFRMDFRFAHHMLNDSELQDQLYHLFNYLLVYGAETSDKQEDAKELLHETILMIGYFALLNEKHQQLLCKGENTILQKLCRLPFPYFCDKKLKEILFPTLIQASYKHDRSLAIMDQELSIDLIVDFIQLNLKEELPKIIEEDNDYQSMSSLGGGMQLNNGERKANRSPSLSSTKSSNCSLQLELINGNSPFLPLEMRFPKRQWRDAITFYSKVLY